MDRSSISSKRSGKGREAFRTISEVAEFLDLPQHVLRFWESKFSQIKPLKRGGNRRYYRPDDVTLLTAIKKLLHSDGYTIRGVQKLFKSQGIKATILLALDDEGAPSLANARNGSVEQEDGDGLGLAVTETSLPKQSHTDSLKEVLERLVAIRARMN